MNDFLPGDYKVPVGDVKYMKFESGENVFRILSSAIVGWEWWTSETKDGKEIRKPNRVGESDGVPVEAWDDEKNPVKHFWAMVVWNYEDKKVQILEITQRGIQKAIRALTKSKGWGDPKNYDISVMKSGEKLQTTYEVMPIPPAPLDKEIVKKYKALDIDLEQLYVGGDPFAKENVNPDEVHV